MILLLRGLRPSLAVREPGVRTTLHAFVPVLLGRGSVQLSAYVDQVLASYLGAGMVAAMFSAQVLYLLPVSLFGMAVSAAELPEMSSATGGDADRAAHLHERLRRALRRVVFLVVPSAVAFIAIGGSIIALLFQTGRFSADDTRVVWIILAGSALGLSAGTQGRLLGSAFYALGDPARRCTPRWSASRSPARWAGRSRCRSAITSATAPSGARSASPRAPASPRGSSSCCSSAGWPAGSARSRSRPGSASARCAVSVLAGAAGYGAAALVTSSARGPGRARGRGAGVRRDLPRRDVGREGPRGGGVHAPRAAPPAVRVPRDGGGGGGDVDGDVDDSSHLTGDTLTGGGERAAVAVGLWTAA